MKDNSKNNGGGTQKEDSSRYGIKSNKCPLQVKDLIAFEQDIWYIKLVHQIGKLVQDLVHQISKK